MRRKHLIISVMLLFCGILSLSQAQEEAGNSAIQESNADFINPRYQPGKSVDFFPFYVYKDGDYSENHYHPTGKMGDFSDFIMDPYYRENPFSGKTCIKVVYKNSDSKKAGWAGLFWLDPQNNWGENHGGYDLRGADKLTFWAKGEKGGEKISLFQIGGIMGKYRDVGTKSIGPITLSDEWQQYTIYLGELSKKMIVTDGDPNWILRMEPLSRIIGGFCWVVNMTDADHITFYLDEIKYEQINFDIRVKNDL